MSKHKLKMISNLIFWLSTGFALVTLGLVAKDYFVMMKYGICPFSQNRALIFTALGILLVSSLLTTILDARVKKMEHSLPVADLTDPVASKQDQPERERDEAKGQSRP